MLINEQSPADEAKLVDPTNQQRIDISAKHENQHPDEPLKRTFTFFGPNGAQIFAYRTDVWNEIAKVPQYRPVSFP
jgi:hypothetical protein